MEDEAAVFERIRHLIRKGMVEERLPSLSVAVARRGEILWEEAFGWADRERRIEAAPHTMYSLASISKPITATAIMVLQEQGKLDLDRPVNDYLPDTKLIARVGDPSGHGRDQRELTAGATVRRVLDHTSGLPLHWQFFPSDEPRARPPFSETLRRYGNLVTPPGERYQYSNLGYGVLDHVIACVSGKPYRDFMREEVFLPMGMARASIDVGPGLEPYAAERYAPGGLRLPFYDCDHPGGSAVFCSAHDLVRFGMFHLHAELADQKQVLSSDGIEMMQAPSTRTGENGWYGLGWRVADEYGGCRTVGHNGGMDGVSTTLVLAPEAGVAVAALANAASRLPFDVAKQALTALLPGAAAMPAGPAPEKKEETPVFQPPAALIGEWRGSVANLNLTLRFREDGDVHVRLGDQLKTLLTDGRFEDGTLTGCFAGDIGTEDANRRPYHLHLDLRLRGEVLNGAVIVKSPPRTNLDSALSHWTQLEQVR